MIADITNVEEKRISNRKMKKFQEEEKLLRDRPRTFCATLFSLVIFGLVIVSDTGWFYSLWKGCVLHSPLLKEAAATSTASAHPFGSDLIVNIAKAKKPAVVNISTTRIIKSEREKPEGRFGRKNPLEEFFGKDPFEHFFERMPPRQQKRRSLGSGFIIDEVGYILTNYHVIEKSDEITVTLDNGKEYDARVVGTDPKTDIALIKVEAQELLPYVQMGHSEALEVGEWVVAIGNPFGLDQTVTVGVVSAKGRQIGSGPYDDFIQTDAAINHGNSGGPLFNIDGEVIGINTAIIAAAQGIGFAIPINMVRNILNDLKTKGSVTRGWLGVVIQKVTPGLAESFNLPEDEGALVADVMKDGPAKKAGIRRGDVIVEFDGKKIETMEDLPKIVANTFPDKTVEVKLLREGRTKIIQVQIAKMEEPERFAKKETSEKIGMTIQDITPKLAKRLGIEDIEGVIVSEVESGSPADDAGMRQGDIILELNRQKVDSVNDYQAVLGKTQDKSSMLVLVKRGENTIFVPIKNE